LPELVKDQVNGFIFSDAAQLAEQIEVRLHHFLQENYLTKYQELLVSFPDSSKLKILSSSLQPPTRSHLHPHLVNAAVDDVPDTDEQSVWTSWEDNWNRVMRRLILSDVNLYQQKYM